MINSKILGLFIFIFFALSSYIVIAQVNNNLTKKVQFSFSLDKQSNTSAGVYKKDGTLIRTLWSGNEYKAGEFFEVWDGFDDNGKAVFGSDFEIKVLSANVQYSWDGARIGNTSAALTGDTKHRLFEPARGLAVSGTTVYVAGGYNEAWPAQYKFDMATPQKKTWVGRLRTTDQATDYVATDGKRVYWAGYDPYQNGTPETFVFATNVSDDALVNFGSNGTTAHMEWGKDYSAIAYKIAANSHISGLAVQQTGNYLFVSREGQNELQVLNKSTGVLVQKITIAGISTLGIDVNGYLWANHGSILEKYGINSNGTLTSAATIISSITSIGGFGFSPDGTTIAVCDVASQVVKGFNTTNGALTWTLGTPGGYLTDASVTDNKFYFTDLRGEKLTYIAYLPDGSFYVGDPGNCRTQHYSSSRKFIDRIMFMPNTYKTSVDKLNPTRVYADFMQFEIDYSKPLAEGWTLKKNWAGNFKSTYNAFSKVFNPITFPNGRVYSMVQIDAVQYPVVELVEGGAIRYTGLTLGQRAFLGTDGSKIQPIVGANVVWNRYPLTGYDGNNNPVWSSTPEVLATVPYNENDPMPANNMYEFPVTASNKIMFFNSNRVDGAHGNDFHLGVVKRDSIGWLWKTARGTDNSYSGQFPEDGFFDNGNGVEIGNRAGGAALVLGDNIFWGYHGEFWKQSQTNKWNHIDANTGLFIGQFGVLTKDHPNEEAFAGGAGNVFEGTVVTVNDTSYLYHNDEGVNNGVHRWKITGLNTIAIQTATLTNNKADTLNGMDLMEGITYSLQSLPNNYKGWTRTPANDDFNNYENSWWQVTTGVKSYDRLKKPDLYFRYAKGVNNYYSVERTFNNNIKLTSWKLSGKLNWDGNTRTQAHLKAGSFLEILDNAGKIISRLDLRQTSTDVLNVIGNDKILMNTFPLKDNLKDHKIEISGRSGMVTFKFDNYEQTTSATIDAGADISKPAKMRLYFFTAYNGGGDADGRAVSIRDFEFYNNNDRKSLPSDKFRSASSGDWKTLTTWESSEDGINWNPSTVIPSNTAGQIELRKTHSVFVKDSILVDQLILKDTATLSILPGASIMIDDGIGDDISIIGTGKLIIKSDATGTGRIGKSLGNISGNVTVERFLPAKQSVNFRMLASTVTSTTSIKDNWQSGTNNTNMLINSNPKPGYGTHITGSITGQNGFDASLTGQPSLFTFNWLTSTPVWIPIGNTDVNNLDAKTGYLLLVRGDRGVDITKNIKQSTNTTLSATGTVLTGNVNFTTLLGNGKNSVVTNPYASPIDWTLLQKSNRLEFENYYTMWDPNVGSKGGYVTVDATGTTSVRRSEATTDIQTGQAFIVKAKAGVTSPKFVVTESDKCSGNNPYVFRTSSIPMPKLYASLYYIDEGGNRNLADGVLSRFSKDYVNGIDGDDAEDIPNFDENISWKRNGHDFSIESRPLPKDNDTLFLNIDNIKQQAYEWQFNLSDFDPNQEANAFLHDNYLGTEIPIEMDGPTVIIFTVTPDAKSSDSKRFKIVFTQLKTLPVNLLYFNAAKHGKGVQVDWKTSGEQNIDRYVVERSPNGQVFKEYATTKPTGNATSVNNYSWYDDSPMSGFNYYRLKSTETDGQINYSKTIRILFDRVTGSVNIFPNPVNDDNLGVQFYELEKDDYNLVVWNNVGQKIYEQLLKHPGGTLKKSIHMPSLTQGVYRVSIKSSKLSLTQNLVRL